MRPPASSSMAPSARLERRNDAAGSRSSRAWRALPILLLLFLTSFPPAIAHDAGVGDGGSFVAGFTHPLYGLDHVAAMVAVGIWGAFLGAPAIWLLPVLFPLVMALGGALAISGLSLPMIEPGIALSSVVLGLSIVAAWRAPLALAGAIVAVFAICHGYAHGAEIPHAANPVGYAAGFVLATGMLHLLGILFGTLSDRPEGAMVLRGSGAMIALAGAGFLIGFF